MRGEVVSWTCEGCGHVNKSMAASTSDVEECWECDRPRGWTYDGPSETGDPAWDSPAVLAEMQDRIQRRLK